MTLLYDLLCPDQYKHAVPHDQEDFYKLWPANKADQLCHYGNRVQLLAKLTLQPSVHWLRRFSQRQQFPYICRQL